MEMYIFIYFIFYLINKTIIKKYLHSRTNKIPLTNKEAYEIIHKHMKNTKLTDK